jgi:hypothetical protein
MTHWSKTGMHFSPIIFFMVMGDAMNKVTGKEREINCGVSQQLEDLDFVDDIYLLSHTFNKIYMKLKDLENTGKAVGLKISCEKTKTLRINVECNKKFQIEC